MWNKKINISKTAAAKADDPADDETDYQRDMRLKVNPDRRAHELEDLEWDRDQKEESAVLDTKKYYYQSIIYDELIKVENSKITRLNKAIEDEKLKIQLGADPETELINDQVNLSNAQAELQQLIDQRSNPWGVTVSSVEMRDVVIPGALQDAMSREAQAAREKQARIILGQAEMEIANSFREAAKAYHENPTALHLRAMNMLYEGLKEKGALMLIPSSAVESMGMGGLMGAAALRQQTLTGAGGGEVKVE